MMDGWFRGMFASGPTLYVSEDDWPALEAALRERIGSPYAGSSLVDGPMISGVRIHRSALIPAGQALLVDPGRQPAMVSVTSWSEVLTTVTALALAGVDERAG